MENWVKILVVINGGTFITGLVLLVRITRFLTVMEIKVDTLWKDYEKRTLYTHKRATDE